MFPENLSPAFDRIAKRWDKLEALIKRSENLIGNAIGPAIFELRYAGRKLVDAIHEGCSGIPNEGVIAETIKEVEECCNRGQHDAIDAIVIFLRRNIDLSENTFGADLLLEHWPDYLQAKSKLDELGEVVVSSRQCRGQRTEIYNKMEDEEIPAILHQIRKLSSSEAALVALAKKRREEDAEKEEQSATTRRTLADTASTLTATRSTLKITIWIFAATLVSLALVGGGIYLAHRDAAEALPPSQVKDKPKPAEQQTK